MGEGGPSFFLFVVVVKGETGDPNKLVSSVSVRCLSGLGVLEDSILKNDPSTGLLVVALSVAG